MAIRLLPSSKNDKKSMSCADRYRSNSEVLDGEWEETSLRRTPRPYSEILQSFEGHRGPVVYQTGFAGKS